MKPWKLTTKDFYTVLRKVQDFRCYLSGIPLTPATTGIILKTPVSQGGERCLENVCLVAKPFDILARHYSVKEIQNLAKNILNHAEGRLPEPVSRIESSKKQPWHKALDKVSNFNASISGKKKLPAAGAATWGGAATVACRTLNTKMNFHDLSKVKSATESLEGEGL